MLFSGQYRYFLIHIDQGRRLPATSDGKALDGVSSRATRLETVCNNDISR